MKKLITVLLLISSSAFAVPEFYSISRSPRALGMGGAFYGLSDDHYALFYNPAGLATIKEGGRFTLLGVSGEVSPSTLDALDVLTHSSGKSTAQLADTLSQFQGKPLYAGASPNILSYYGPNFAIGILLADFKSDFALLGRDLDTKIDATAISDTGLFVSYANSFMDETLHIGITAKAMARAGGRKVFNLTDIAQKNGFTFDPEKLGGVGGGIDFDLGGSYDLPLPKVGPFLLYRASLVFNNLLASDFSMVNIKGGPPPALARTMTIAGYTALEGWGPFENFHLLLDFAEFGIGGQSDPDFGKRGGSFFKHVNLGVEAPFAGRWIVPRVGIHQGYFTAGLTLDIRAIKIDLATYAEELSSGIARLASRRYVARLEIGWGTPPPAITGKEVKHHERMREFQPTEKEIEPPHNAKPTPPVVEPNKVEPVNGDPNAVKPEGKPAEKDVPLMQEEKGAPPPKPQPTPEPQARKPQSEDVSVPADEVKTPPQNAEPSAPAPEEVTIPR